jgi:hypothetical protein
MKGGTSGDNNTTMTAAATEVTAHDNITAAHDNMTTTTTTTTTTAITGGEREVGGDDDVVLPSPDAASLSYARMGIAEESPIIALVKPSMPDCMDMTPQSKKHAMKEYILDKKAYQKERKAATDALLKERIRAAEGRTVH